MARISIIVPIYNVEPYLKRCLDSLINQTSNDYELLLINDCSTDSSSDIAEAFARKYPERIKLFSNSENIGLGATRNFGLSQVHTEYVMYVDSDDYVAEDYIQRYLSAIDESGADVVIGGYTRDVDGKCRPHFVSDSVWSLVTYTIACAKIYKTSFLRNNKLRFSQTRCGEDIYYSTSLFCCSPTYRIIHYAGYHYCFNRSSITGTLDFTKNHERFVSKLFDEILADHPTAGLSYQQKLIVQYCYLANMINALAIYNRGCGTQIMKKKYHFVLSDAKEKFPDLEQNPYISLVKPKGQTMKIRIAVWLFMKLKKARLELPLLALISRLPK